MKQKNSFDQETLRSLLNSFVLTMVSAFGAFLVASSQGATLGTSALIALGTLGAFLVNIPREYLKGETEQKQNNG